MKRREGTKDDGRVAERDGIAIGVEQPVDARKPTWGSRHTVVRRRQAVDELVPRRCTWQKDLDDDPDEVHVAERSSPQVKSLFRAEQPQERSDDEGENEVNDAVREPGEYIEKLVREPSEQIRDVRTIQHGLERWQEDDRDVRAPAHGNEARRVEREEPCEDRSSGNEELGGKGYEERNGVEDGYHELERKAWGLHYTHPERGEGDVEYIDGVGERPFMLTESPEGILR